MDTQNAVLATPLKKLRQFAQNFSKKVLKLQETSFFKPIIIVSSCFFEHVERIFDTPAARFWKKCQKISDGCPNMDRNVFQSTIFLTISLWTRGMEF